MWILFLVASVSLWNAGYFILAFIVGLLAVWEAFMSRKHRQTPCDHSAAAERPEKSPYNDETSRATWVQPTVERPAPPEGPHIEQVQREQEEEYR